MRRDRAALPERRRVDAESDRFAARAGLGPLLRHLYRRRKGVAPAGDSHTGRHLLRPLGRTAALRRPHRLRRSAHHARPLVSVGQPAGPRALSDRHFVPLHHERHPAHRIDAHRHSRSIGTRHGSLFRCRGLRRGLYAAYRLRHRADRPGRHARHCGQQPRFGSHPFPQTLSATRPQTEPTSITTSRQIGGPKPSSPLGTCSATLPSDLPPSPKLRLFRHCRALRKSPCYKHAAAARTSARRMLTSVRFDIRT